MESLKSFFAKDWVKVVAGGLYVIANGLIFTVLQEGPIKQTAVALWNGVITPAAIFFGITSGGTSGLRNNTSNAVTTQLKAEGVVKVP